MPTKFRKKPVVIEAVQWTGENTKEISDFVDTYPIEYRLTDEGVFVKIQTLEGVMIGTSGDWIIKGVKGELYPCKPDIFEATYERVEDNAN